MKIQVLTTGHRRAVSARLHQTECPAMILLVLQAELGALDARAHIDSMHIPTHNQF